MTPTSRNTLIVGGGLIVAALLFTCGPLDGLLGEGDSSQETVAGRTDETGAEPPAVGAGPPRALAGALGAAAAGAALGAEAGRDSAMREQALESAAPVVEAGEAEGATNPRGPGEGQGGPLAGLPVVPAVASATAAEGASDGDATKTQVRDSSQKASAPPVSAGPPSSAEGTVPVEDPILLAKHAFDDVFDADEGKGLSGPVIGRFAPPVAALPDARLPLRRDGPLGDGIDGVRRPCDAPGAGCRKQPPIPPVPPFIPGPPVPGGTDRGPRS